jgi:hypothetical protein
MEKKSGNKPDDLEAVRSLVNTLEAFEKQEQERIIRWAREKLGLSPSTAQPPSGPGTASRSAQGERAERIGSPPKGRDIKSFIDEKFPSTNVHFAATVAYYYQFEAPEPERKESINAHDLQEATRLVGRARFNDPGQTLRDSHKLGLLDKTGESGAFRINTVGENLVAMTLPMGEGRSRVSKKKTAKKHTSKRVAKASPTRKVAKKKTRQK